jgi:hypothetical protein
LELPSTYKKKRNAGKDYESESEASFKKDFFIIIVGLILILLAFVLFLTVSGLQLEKGFPLSGKVVVSDDGELLDAGHSKIAPDSAQGYIQTGIILGLVVLVVFISALVIIRWVKKGDILKTSQSGKDLTGSWKE